MEMPFLLVLLVAGLTAFDLLAMRFGVDSRDAMTTTCPSAERRLERNHGFAV